MTPHEGPDTAPAISVVLPTFQRRDAVVAVVDALLAEDIPGSEVVVVVDGSTDGTQGALSALAAQHPRLVVVQQPNSGKRAANRVAAARARGRVLVFLDDDVLPCPGLVAGHLAAHEGRDDLVVVGYMPTTVPEPATGEAFATVLYAQEYEGRVRAYEADPQDVLMHLWMGNVSMTRAAYERAGLASMEGYRFRHEDRDMGLACREAGLVGVFDRSILGLHQHSRTVAQFRRDSLLQGAGRAALAERHAAAGAHLDEMLSGLPAPLALVVRAARRGVVGRPLAGLLAGALRAAVQLDDPRPALLLARVLRRLDHQSGMAEHLRTGSAASATF